MKLKSYLKKYREDIVREVIVTLVIGGLISFGFNFLAGIKIDKRVAERQVLYEFERTFFDNQKYRNISTAIEEQYLYNKGILREINGGEFTDYDIDDYLGLLFDIWSYERDRLVYKDFINNQFGYYLCITYNNKEIKEYRSYLNSIGFTDYGSWGFLDDLANENGYIENDCKTY